MNKGPSDPFCAQVPIRRSLFFYVCMCVLIGSCFIVSPHVLFLDLSVLDIMVFLHWKVMIWGVCEEEKVNMLPSVTLNWKPENVILEMFYFCFCRTVIR